MSEPRVAIADLKARLSAHLARAREGEEIIVTDRGIPVARLSPLGGTALREGREAELARSGLARGHGAPLDAGFLDHPRPSDPTGRSLEILPSNAVRDEAARLFRRHSLRAADALQLAAAIVWAGPARGAEFVTRDERLALVARLEGFRVV